MAKKDTPSWTTRIGGNRTLVLGIMILMLCLFTVEDYILKAVGLGSRGGDFVSFNVHGRPVSMDAGKYQSQYQDWRRFHQGQWRLMRSDPRTGEKPEAQVSEQDFLSDLIMTELAKDAGVRIPDATLREFLEAFPLFSDGEGHFDPKNFDQSREQIYGGLGSRALEEEFRRLLLLSHFRRIYANSFLAVTDDEIYRKWKSDHQKLEATFAWSPVSPLRAAMKIGDAKPEEIETHWKDERVQKRHKTPRKYCFEAAWVLVSAVDDKAYLAARETWKGEAGFALGETEGLEYWSAHRDFDFRDVPGNVELLETLRKENEERVKKEDAENSKKAPPPPPVDEPRETPVVAPAASVGPPPYDKLEDAEKYRRYWKHRIEKEIWLKKLLDRVRSESAAADASMKAVAAKWSRPGLQVKFHAQQVPIDQYEVEKLPGVGAPNCPLRYVLNSKKEEDVGKVHGEVLDWGAIADDLTQRGWLVFVPRQIVPDAVPPLESVKDKVAAEVLDEKARVAARLALETLRQEAEGSRKSLEAAAKEKGLETAKVGPFNEYTWRPPAGPKDDDAKEGAPEEGWKSAERRISTVMGRYGGLRDTPVGAFSSVLDDAKGSGAFYLAQVNTRADPAFEEMTQAQVAQARRGIIQERLRVVDQEWTYGRLRERHSLMVGGKPAPEPEESRRGK